MRIPKPFLPRFYASHPAFNQIEEGATNQASGVICIITHGSVGCVCVFAERSKHFSKRDKHVGGRVCVNIGFFLHWIETFWSIRFSKDYVFRMCACNSIEKSRNDSEPFPFGPQKHHHLIIILSCPWGNRLQISNSISNIDFPRFSFIKAKCLWNVNLQRDKCLVKMKQRM